ncbi:hypothetical protein JXQ31_17315 [candidate division KSB1 bacterium]|nr:hypothetical protein [candidate division KSB1 bacterium]
MIVCSTNKSQKVISQQNTGTLPTINIKYRFTSVVMVTVKGSNLRAHITPEPGALFAGDRRTMKSDRKWMIKVPVINDGNVHITVQGDVELYSENGQLLEKSLLNVGRGYLLPEKRRVFIATGEGPLPDGIYKANIRIGNLNTKEYATESMDFYVLQGTSYPGTPENEKINQIKNQSHGFILDKSEINIECVPGGKIFQALRLSNLTNDTLNIEHTIQHWKLDQDGNINFSKDLQKNIPLISLNINSFKLLPQKRKNLKLSVYMPEQTEGEYFLAITFSKKGTTLTNNIEKLVTQSVLLGIVSKGTLIKTMELQAFNISLILETGTEFEIVFNNTGNSRIYPEGKISIFDQNNTRIDNQIQFATNSFILPKSTRKYIVQHDRILPNGIYTAQLEILFDEAKQTIKKEIKFKKQNNKIAIVN